MFARWPENESHSESGLFCIHFVSRMWSLISRKKTCYEIKTSLIVVNHLLSTKIDSYPGNQVQNKAINKKLSLKIIMFSLSIRRLNLNKKLLHCSMGISSKFHQNVLIPMQRNSTKLRLTYAAPFRRLNHFSLVVYQNREQWKTSARQAVDVAVLYTHEWRKCCSVHVSLYAFTHTGWN